jgi:hypothetical protein
MRATAACFTLTAALFAVCCVGSAAARTNDSSSSRVVVEKIVINPAHPNIVTFIIDHGAGHAVTFTFGGPAVKASVSPKYHFQFSAAPRSSSEPKVKRVYGIAVVHPSTNKFVIRATYPPQTGSPGHGTCYVASVMATDGKPSHSGPVREHCVNTQLDINI